MCYGVNEVGLFFWFGPGGIGDFFFGAWADASHATLEISRRELHTEIYKPPLGYLLLIFFFKNFWKQYT